MIKVNIQETAKARGVTSAYQLQKLLKIAPAAAARLWKNAGSSISYEMMDKLCTHLECEPQDLFKYTKKSVKK